MEKKDPYPRRYIIAASLWVSSWLVFYLLNFAGMFLFPETNMHQHAFFLAGLYAVVTASLTFVFGVCNIVRSFRYFWSGQRELCLANWMKLKYGMIPCFLINYGILFVLGGVIGILSMGFSLLWFIPLNSLITWLYLLPGAFYGIQAIGFCRKEKQKSPWWGLFHGALQFFFLADVLDTVYLTRKEFGAGKRVGTAILILYVVLGVGVSCILVHMFRM